MKIGLCGDVHWSQYSSILRKNGEKYSVRLENLIQTINWFNELTNQNKCFANFYLGDFFDKPEMCAAEISALTNIKWDGCSQYFICGNHEMFSVDHLYSSAKVFDLLDTGEVLDKPCLFELGGVEFAILPYILEDNRKAITEYFKPKTDKKRIILSHNDLAGIQMGAFVSKAGFSVDEIEANCDLFINGHLHNGDKITDKIINIGNITGQNFSEDATKYDHCAFILDTDTLKIDVYENPYACNFYKIDVRDAKSFPKFKQNSVVSIQCLAEDLDYIKREVENNSNIIESRIVVEHKILAEGQIETDFSSIDHIKKFNDFILEKLGNSDVVINELEEISK